MKNRIAALLLALALAPLASAQQPSAPWSFAVSGDSRNCGDVVMPAIAKGVHDDGAKFYYHLGDFRAIYDFDQDGLLVLSLLPPTEVFLEGLRRVMEG